MKNNKNAPTIPVEETAHSLSQEHQIRLEKVKELEKTGINPWPAAKKVTATSAQVLSEYREDQPEKIYAVAGRILIIRHHGKASFVIIQDAVGKLQLYFKQDELGEQRYEWFKHQLNTGDYIWAQGSSFKTKMGEITLKVDDFELQSKMFVSITRKISWPA